MAKDDEVLKEGKYIRLVNRNSWEFVERVNATGIVAIAAVNENNELVLVEQYRPAFDKRVVELPSGLAGDIPGVEDELMIEAARRELMEETGYEAPHMDYIMEGPISSGLSTEVVSFFKAKNVKKVNDGGGDETEDIEVHAIAVNEIEHWLGEKRKTGTLVDPKVYAGLYFIKD